LNSIILSLLLIDTFTSQDAANQSESDTAVNVEKTEGWFRVHEELKKYDEDWIQRRSDHISDLQLFVRLPSAILPSSLTLTPTPL
jgi:hypothetical protein